MLLKALLKTPKNTADIGGYRVENFSEREFGSQFCRKEDSKENSGFAGKGKNCDRKPTRASFSTAPFDCGKCAPSAVEKIASQAVDYPIFSTLLHIIPCGKPVGSGFSVGSRQFSPKATVFLKKTSVQARLPFLKKRTSK